MAKQNLKSIIENIKLITESPSMVASILDFERVLDEMDMYAYANWQYGELVEGPVFEKYFVTCTFMWPYTRMPDPDAAKRLLHYDIEVEYNLDNLEVPVKIKSPYDYKPGTKFAKHKLLKVWLVTITIPRDLISNIQKGTVELENEQLDLEDIEKAYSEGVDEDENDNEEGDENNGSEEGGGQEMGMPGGNPGGLPGPGAGAPNV